MTNVSRKAEITVGVFVLLGLVVLGAMIIKLGNFSPSRAGSYEVSVVFDDATGLREGAHVQMGGMQIGRIASEPHLNADLRAMVELEIFAEHKLPVGSEYRISSAGLLGDKLVQVVRPRGMISEYEPAGAMIMGESGGSIDQIASEIPTLAKEATELIKMLQMTVEKVDVALLSVSTTADRINNGVLNEKNTTSISNILARVDSLASSLDTTGKALPDTIGDLRDTLAAIEKAALQADQLIARADREIDKLEPALAEVPETLRAIARASRSADATLRDLRQSDGLLATLTRDEEVAADVKEFTRNLKRDGILRYRDTEEEPKPDPRSRFQGKRR